MRAGTQARWGCDVTRASLAWQGKGCVKRPPWLWGSGYASPGGSESYSVLGKDCQTKMGGDHVLDVD